jgi:hypothetical protein
MSLGDVQTSAVMPWCGVEYLDHHLLLGPVRVEDPCSHGSGRGGKMFRRIGSDRVHVGLKALGCGEFKG